jgi:hypothetical protein
MNLRDRFDSYEFTHAFSPFTSLTTISQKPIVGAKTQIGTVEMIVLKICQT